MSDSLRARIAAVQAQHHHWDYAGALTCACGEDFGLSDGAGWEAAVKEWANHVADAVIAELKLREERIRKYPVGGVTDPDEYRYVTEWENDEPA